MLLKKIRKFISQGAISRIRKKEKGIKKNSIKFHNSLSAISRLEVLRSYLQFSNLSGVFRSYLLLYLLDDMEATFLSE